MSKRALLVVCGLLVLFSNGFIRADVVVVNMCLREIFKVVHMEMQPKQNELFRREIEPGEFCLIKHVDVKAQQGIWVAGRSWPGPSITGLLARLPGVKEKMHYHKFELPEEGHCIIFIRKSMKGTLYGGMVEVDIERLDVSHLPKIEYIIDVIEPGIKEIECQLRSLESSCQYIEVKKSFEQLRFFKKSIDENLFIQSFCSKLRADIDMLSNKLLEFICLTEKSRRDRRSWLSISRVGKERKRVEAKAREMAEWHVCERIAEEKAGLFSFKPSEPSDDLLVRSRRNTGDSIELLDQVKRSQEAIRKLMEDLDGSFPKSTHQPVAVEPLPRELDRFSGIPLPVEPLSEQPQGSYLQAATRAQKIIDSADCVPVTELMREAGWIDERVFAETYSIAALQSAAQRADRWKKQKRYQCYARRLRAIARVCKKAVVRKKQK